MRNILFPESDKIMGIMLLTAVLAFGPAAAARAAAAPDSPFLFIEKWDDKMPPGLLMGGFAKGDKWWNLMSLPIVVNGRITVPENCGRIDAKEGSPAATALLPGGMRLVYYTSDGKKLGSASTKKDALYSCRGEASGQTLISPDLADKKPERGAIAPGFAVGLREGAAVTFMSTRKAVSNGGKRIVFSTSGAPGGKPASITYDKAGKEEPEAGGVLNIGGKNTPFAGAMWENPKDIRGFFIDLNSDGVLEFALAISSDSFGGIALYSLTGRPGMEEAVLAIDMGE